MLGASGGAWAGWSRQHQHHPPTTNISVGSYARQRKTRVRWVCGSPRKKTQYPGVNNKYIGAKQIKATPNEKKSMLINNYTKYKQKFQFLRRRVVYTTAELIRAQRFSLLKTVGRAETFESWPSEEGVNSKLMSLGDMVAIVAEVYDADCQLCLRLSNTTLAT